MRHAITSLLCLIFLTQVSAQPDSLLVSKLYEEALGRGECHENLRVLCKDIGHRLSGSESLDRAIVWGERLLASYGADEVELQTVNVPHWSRGTKAQATFNSKKEEGVLRITALGGSVPTEGELTAQVIEVKRLEDLEKLGEAQIKGKIVLFNRAMDPLMINTGSAYGGAFDQRSDGASTASKYGAVGVLVRSLTHALDTFPHTGSMTYREGVTPIPAAAISTVDADRLHQVLLFDPATRVSMNMDCIKYENRDQANVIATLRGNEENTGEHVIVLGGHLDSWDIGEGAHDDGAGIVHVIEALRIMKAIGYQPRHTIRVVLYINEENGNHGGITYAERASENNETHIAAIESDSGGFTPRGYNTECGDTLYQALTAWIENLEIYGIHQVKRGWSGVDIRPLKPQTTNLFGFIPDGQRYFDYHHSNRDVFENVNKRELELGAASIAALAIYLDMYLP
jgi:carboxypeptidase Q